MIVINQDLAFSLIPNTSVIRKVPNQTVNVCENGSDPTSRPVACSRIHFNQLIQPYLPISPSGHWL